MLRTIFLTTCFLTLTNAVTLESKTKGKIANKNKNKQSTDPCPFNDCNLPETC